MTEWYTEITIDNLYCQNCKTRYTRFRIGRKHVHVTCKTCNITSENGLVFNIPRNDKP